MFFGKIFGSNQATEIELLAPFAMTVKKEAFCKVKTELLFKKILHRCYSRSEGATDKDKIASLFDSSEKSNAPKGLISLVANAMMEKQQMALIYEVGIVRKATTDEQKQIEADYKKSAKSTKGVLVNFKDYWLADLVQAYMAIVFDILSTMNTQVGLSKALQIKINALRGTVSAVGKDDPIEQAKAINKALNKGESVLLDKNDEVVSSKLDSETVKNAIALVNSLIATDLGVSLSFVNGELTTGMSATGEADANADEYGFQDYFNSIFKPTCDKLYGWNLQFMSDDWRWFGAMADKLIIVENSGLLSDEQKLAFANRLIPNTKAKTEITKPAKPEASTPPVAPPTDEKAK
jgi:co-chaperonin GroES (HSP10)